MAVRLVLAEDPTADARIRAVVEALLDERAVCRAQPPAALTEVRWYAAHALAAERKAAGSAELVRVSAVIPPLGSATLSELAEAAYGEDAPPRQAAERFEKPPRAGDRRAPARRMNARPGSVGSSTPLA
jgi:hypothetical protein